MRWVDYVFLAFTSLRFARVRSLLTALGIAVGVTAVVLLTAVGSGTQNYILGQFSQFGAHIIAVAPGKNTTMGISGSVISTVRPLSVDDALDLQALPGILTSVPVVQGNAPVEHGKLSRWTNVLGVNHQVPETWNMSIGLGQFLPKEDPGQARNLAVIGHTVYAELFGDSHPLGQRIRIGQERFRVVGVMASKGNVLGFDMDDMVYIPIDRALSMFNRDSLMEVDLAYSAGRDEADVIDRIRKRLIQRHGSEDFTITSQGDMLDSLGSILDILKAVVAGLGGISLLVGGVGIFTIMSIAVNERIHEIGLLRALGASRRQVSWLFLIEAAVLSGLGGLAGLLLGLGIVGLVVIAFPSLPVAIAWDYVLLAELLAISTGIIAGLVPARRASALPPVEALRSE